MKMMFGKRRKRFQILFHGTGICIPVVDCDVKRAEGGDDIIGFYTTRFVDSENAEEAIANGAELLRRELEEKHDPSQISGLSLQAEEVEEVSWWCRRFRRNFGFGFYWADDEEAEEDAEDTSSAQNSHF